MSKMRPRMTREQWADLIEQQQHSDLSIEAFCQEQDIGFASFGKWKRRLSTAGAKVKNDTQQSDFKPVHVKNPPPELPADQGVATITLSIGSGITLTIVNSHSGI